MTSTMKNVPELYDIVCPAAPAKCMAPFSYLIYPINGNYLLPDCVFTCILIAASTAGEVAGKKKR